MTSRRRYVLGQHLDSPLRSPPPSPPVSSEESAEERRPRRPRSPSPAPSFSSVGTPPSRSPIWWEPRPAAAGPPPPAPPPPPAEAPHFVTTDEAFRDAQARSTHVQLGAVANAASCFLCEFGHARPDSTSEGSRLFSGLMTIINQLGVCYTAVQLTRLIARYHAERMVPVFARAGVPLPPLDEVATLRHFTEHHVLHPTLTETMMLRDTLKVRSIVLDRIFKNDGSVHATNLKSYERLTLLVKKLQDGHPGTLPLAEAVAEGSGQMRPSEATSLAGVPRANLVALSEQLPPDSFAWLREAMADVTRQG